MEIRRIKPQAKLSEFIKEIYSVAFINEDRIPILDDCCHDVIFYKEKDATLYSSEFKDGSELLYHVFSIFKITPPFTLEVPNTLSFLTVKFQPWCNHLFFGKRTDPGIHDTSEDFKELVRVEEVKNLFELKDPFTVLQSQLLKFVEGYALNERQQFLREIIEHIYKEIGQVKVSELEAHFEQSRQYLNSLFKENVHYSIKYFIGMVRVMEAVKIQVNSPQIKLTDLSYEVGYYDQAHFIRDFNKVTGMSPKKFFQKKAPFFQRHKV